ncbi:hypothetical protein TSUD_133970 [Trifolium subterraneum]|uniref:Uncharacterized protein n=1 Tax=Trifolium subterraneum TaxID=3900 RepID=A0A2Z6NMK6_TRISU|nr:hypothetical protein TSUD_133970 [Trifolium subterraneum]
MVAGGTDGESGIPNGMRTAPVVVAVVAVVAVVVAVAVELAGVVSVGVASILVLTMPNSAVKRLLVAARRLLVSVMASSNCCETV